MNINVSSYVTHLYAHLYTVTHGRCIQVEQLKCNTGFNPGQFLLFSYLLKVMTRTLDQ